MRRAVGILTIALVPAFAAAIALAADPYETSPGSHHDTGATSGTMGTSHAGYMGEHTMTGRITDIDKDKGRVTVDAQGEELDLHFPKTALQNMNKGDEVTVSLGIKPASGTSRGSTSGTSGMGTRNPSGPAGSDYPQTR